MDRPDIAAAGKNQERIELVREEVEKLCGVFPSIQTGDERLPVMLHSAVRLKFWKIEQAWIKGRTP